MKVAPVLSAFRRHEHNALLVHTGQHYDRTMSEVFFEHLKMPRPDINLGVGSGSHAVQTARIMEAFEKVALREKPDYVMVAGDVNSTIACALVSVKLGIRVAHLEAGLRSNDWNMPEEINRILTDRISHILLTPSPDADRNLLDEGVSPDRIYRVGNAMIDSLFMHLDKARETGILQFLGLEAGKYGLITLHRPSNVDNEKILSELIETMGEISSDLPLIFPAHPRTRQSIESFRLMERINAFPNFRMLEPMGYLEFLCLQAEAKLILTDSGGIQEESTALGIPCLTLRENTERPITVTEGTNTIVGSSKTRIIEETQSILSGRKNRYSIPEMWDGKTGERVAELFNRLS